MNGKELVFSETNMLDHIIEHVNGTQNMFFRIGKWGEDIETAIAERGEGNSVVCLQDMVILGKRLQEIKLEANNCLQIIEGYTFDERAVTCNCRYGERLVINPTIIVETEIPSLAELRAVYHTLLTHGGYIYSELPKDDGGFTDERYIAPRATAEDANKVVREQSTKLSAAEENAIKARNKDKASLESNWNNLVARKKHLATHGKVDPKFAEEHPLSANFKKWVGSIFDAVNEKLNTDPRLHIIHKPGSVQDMLNQEINESNEHIKDFRVFPVSSPPQPKEARSFQDTLAWIDQKIHEWNPRARLYSEPVIDEESGEHIQEPEIIGDVNNPQNAGINEDGDDVYNDFDKEGHFLPMGNPNNSTDYQDDFDPQDFGAEAWNSTDNVDDHHLHEYHYREVGITETPKIVEQVDVYKKNQNGEVIKYRQKKKDDNIEWVNESYSNLDELPPVVSDTNFVEDARNWLQRENLIRSTEDPIMHLRVLKTYPVSNDFLEYLEENEITWEVANGRLEQLTGMRKTAAEDIKTFGTEVPPVEDVPIIEQEPHWEAIDSYIPEIPLQ